MYTEKPYELMEQKSDIYFAINIAAKLTAFDTSVKLTLSDLEEQINKKLIKWENNPTRS
jgi:hypothetical protein